MCERVLWDRGMATIHNNHQHGPRDRVRHSEIEMDLWFNSCRQIIGEAWADKIRPTDLLSK